VDPDAVVRRLAAILSADAVSYSRLMAEDEVATVRTLQAHREHLARLVRQHRGRVVDSPGDNLLAEFPSALDAVRSTASLDNEIALRLTVPALVWQAANDLPCRPSCEAAELPKCAAAHITVLPGETHAESLIKTPPCTLGDHQPLEVGSADSPDLARSGGQQGDRDPLAAPTGNNVHIEDFAPAHAVVQVVRPNPCSKTDERVSLVSHEYVDSTR
jgi:hypothetical protein